MLADNASELSKSEVPKFVGGRLQGSAGQNHQQQKVHSLTKKKEKICFPRQSSGLFQYFHDPPDMGETLVVSLHGTVPDSKNDPSRPITPNAHPSTHQGLQQLFGLLPLVTSRRDTRQVSSKVVSSEDTFSGVYLVFFMVAKKDGSWHAVLDLKFLNQFGSLGWRCYPPSERLSTQKTF